ncbi:MULTISPECIES: RNA polymerase sigma factor [Nocardiopsis]|uniref:RNA polymerase sigma-70 factor (ECF subfamily) n=1 Tax=Nocardiopsis sinuspersici TaxID=501010 RepID=A0A1V3BXS9_9ACTN|nr:MULTISPECIES: sigma-70 family RNA polymerase sigma factor [Nocardiopsis]NYH54383.1 RNA polymerase sigma-70 factor (ECF subfamily) [Nocardiopsis sinuspersici]OOC53182.1 RNA polymerase subunit sigma-24 [Nocardiopsis sinuspersici]
MPRKHPVRSREESVARFEELYESTFRDVLGYLLRRTQDPDHSADLVADVFTVVWSRIDDVPPEDQARPWVFGVARKVLANHRRGDQRRNALAARLRADLREVAVTLPEARDPGLGEVGRVFRALPERDREILSLAGWEQLDTGQIAVALGCARGTARVRLHRARNRFARALRRAGLDTGTGAPSSVTTPRPRRATSLKGAAR